MNINVKGKSTFHRSPAHAQFNLLVHLYIMKTKMANLHIS